MLNIIICKNAIDNITIRRENMAYTMIHIIIAEEIFSKFSLNINENDFLIGTIAPDAVHSCEEFSYKLKEKSHFFPANLTWGKVDTCTKANLEG